MGAEGTASTSSQFPVCDVKVQSPPSPVSVSAQTEHMYFEMSSNDAQNGGVSPLRGDESPPHKRYKKWYFRELWTDPTEPVPDLPLSSEDEPMQSAVPDIGSQASAMTMSARGHMFETHFAERRQLIQEMTDQSVPVWHPGQECYRWGGCRHCSQLSLQPHLNRTGAVNPGMLLLRCSSWFRRNNGQTCWYSYPFPMALFHRLPRNLQEEYYGIKQSLRRGSQG